MTIFASRHGYPDKVMWIMSSVFRYTNFGIVSWIHDDFFVVNGKENREKSLDGLRDNLKRVFVKKKRQCLVLFPEGGFLRNRKQISHKFAQKNGLPLLEYCTLPRTGALEVIMEILRPPGAQNQEQVKIRLSQKEQSGIKYSPTLNKVVDVTIAYPDGKPLGIIDTLSAWRPPCTTHVHYKIFDIEQVPRDPKELRHWMYNLSLIHI